MLCKRPWNESMTCVSVTRSEIKSLTDQNTAACQSSFEELSYPSAALSPFPSSEENHPGPAVLWIVLNFLKSSRLGCLPCSRFHCAARAAQMKPWPTLAGVGLSVLPAELNLPLGKSQLLAVLMFPSFMYAGYPELPISFFLLSFSLSICYLMHCTWTASSLDCWLSFLWLCSAWQVAQQWLCDKGQRSNRQGTAFWSIPFLLCYRQWSSFERASRAEAIRPPPACHRQPASSVWALPQDRAASVSVHSFP